MKTNTKYSKPTIEKSLYKNLFFNFVFIKFNIPDHKPLYNVQIGIYKTNIMYSIMEDLTVCELTVHVH